VGAAVGFAQALKMKAATTNTETTVNSFLVIISPP
jgi:hypothetical protein